MRSRRLCAPKRLAGRWLVWLASVSFALALGPASWAHPMGNFSINHYAGITVEKNSVEVRYIVDIAEIPTYQQVQEAGIVTQVGDPTLRPYLREQATAWERGLEVSVNGETIRLAPISSEVIFPAGAGGLPTMKIAVLYRGALHTKEHAGQLRLHYADGNFAGHAGWKEIVVSAGKGVQLDAGQRFQTDRSAQLTNYPTNLLNSPPQDLQVDVTYALLAQPPPPKIAEGSETPRRSAVIAPASNAVAAAANALETPAPQPFVLAANRQATPRSRFTELMRNRAMSPWFLLTAAFFAAGLGALHALEPGHGKTIVAAYLVGSRGRVRHAVGLGLLVTAAHTAGVYLLGAIVLYASKYVIPEQIYPWLSIFSGLVISVLAAYLFLRAWTGVADAGGHDETGHRHWYTLAARANQTEKTVPLRQMLVLGITGGIIPCPAALVVLLSAVSMGRIGFGFFLIVSFSLGLAAVLIAIGVLMVRARGLLTRWRGESAFAPRWLPLVSASAMFVAGLAIALAALPATGLSWHAFSLTQEHLPSFLAIVGLGLFLGMRHSTDPDHIVAVSTIVSRERSVRQGAVIGMMWGFGHTLTIFIVGAAIIVFKLTIPPRLGLSMELAVAGMLILLGILNLTGTLQRITQRFTPAAWARGTQQETSASGKATPAKPGMVMRFGYYQMLRPLAIGLVHGLAGSAAVALLVLSMIRSPAWAIGYLVVFGLGTVLGMMLMTTAIAIPVALSGKQVSRYLTVVSGLVSVCFGIFLVYHIGFVDGLFTSHVHWTPE